MVHAPYEAFGSWRQTCRERPARLASGLRDGRLGGRYQNDVQASVTGGATKELRCTSKDVWLRRSQAGARPLELDPANFTVRKQIWMIDRRWLTHRSIAPMPLLCWQSPLGVA
jgi:hypothetical protein